MPESTEQYKKRILSYVADGNPLDLQQSMPSILSGILKGVAEERLSSRPTPDKWSIKEIVAHLADDELVGAYRIRMILSEPGTDIQAFNQDSWARLGKYDQIGIEESLLLFSILRDTNLKLLKSLTAEQWQLHGIHAERGKETIQDIAAYYAGHDINHLKQIEAILRCYE